MATVRKETAKEQRQRELMYRERVLDLPKNRMTMRVARIGYPDEGLRLEFCIGMPFDFHVEAQLTRSDAESLIEQLRAHLDSKTSDNLQFGTPEPRKGAR